ncbi:c-type cytochrome domain-containing protein [Sphingobacterium suaedae]|uniref:C-type cytochrome domain-containing protein n=1 Tax=Sphingobacterium suaedae TaxID=1686402 RepID=A0ABW5KIK2_9SPHI
MFLEELMTFIGRWHPLLVHLPIGMLVLAFAMATVDLFRRRQQYLSAIRFTLLCGAVAAVVAAITGYFLSRNGGYEVDVLGFHQWLGIAVAVVSLVTLLLYRETLGSSQWWRRLQKQRFGFMLTMLVLLGLTGHFGGTLTHGEGYLKDALPTVIKHTLGIAQPTDEIVSLPNAQEAVVYQDIIQPILKQRCQSCHGEKKQEGGLALHNQQMLLRGGDGGAVLAAGDTANSVLYSRLILPEGHEKRMPPKGRTPITPDQIKLISWWVSSGADFAKKAKELEQPKEILAILNKLEAGQQVETGILYADLSVAPPLPEDKVNVWQAKGIKIMPVAADNNMVVINTVNYPEFSDADLHDLLQIKDNIVQLKIGRTAITDEGMKAVAQFPVLCRLHLEYTGITDAGLAYLHRLKNLAYINLVGTKVTDNALIHLRKIPKLKHVYAFHTGLRHIGGRQERRETTVDTGNYILPFLASDTITY